MLRYFERKKMSTPGKAYKGLPMEGFIASWYAKNTARDVRRFRDTAREIEERVPSGARLLEVARGPGYLAIELAQRGYAVTGLDISKSFVDIATRNAAQAAVAIKFENGDAAHMPFPDATFDVVVCTAAFKNFSDPIREEVGGMNLSPLNAALVRWTFRSWLLKRAYTPQAVLEMERRSRFGGGEIVQRGIGFDLRLAKQAA